MNDQTLPSWLAPTSSFEQLPEQDQQTLLAKRRANLSAIQETQFIVMFDRALEQLVIGQPLSRTVEMDPRHPDYAKFLRWIHSDPDRKRQYEEAKMIGAEFVEDDLLRIADADESVEDVARSTLRINTRKWLLGVWNKKKYGETRQAEQNITINLVDAMREAQERVDRSRTIEGSPLRVIDGD